MENKLTKSLAVLAVLGLMSTGPVAYAEPQDEGPKGAPEMQQPGPGDKGPVGGDGFHHRDRGPKDFFNDLNLTPEQKEKLKEQREAKKDSNKTIREQMKVKMQALHEAIAKPGTKRADVNGLVDEVNALKGQMFAQKTNDIFAMKEVLTPEQFAKMQEQHKERWRKMNKSHSPSKKMEG